MVKLFKFISWICFLFFYRVKLINKKNVPEKGAAILCANHISELDMFFIGYRLKRSVHYMAKGELFRNPFSALFFRSLDAFPVNRGTADRESLRTAFRLLKEGHIIGIFPEGTRRKPGKIIKMKHGAAVIAIKTGVPIIPVAVQGSNKMFGEVKVVYGEPYCLNAEKNRKYASEELTEITEGIMSKIYTLMEEN